MIIPIKCFTCGNVLADKYQCYLERVRAQKSSSDDPNQIVYMTRTNRSKKTAEGHVLDEMGLTNVCCRRHILTHVDIE
jgi:DNA-directed RNA polymerase subunit N (RpoN/RPB10)